MCVCSNQRDDDDQVMNGSQAYPILSAVVDARGVKKSAALVIRPLSDTPITLLCHHVGLLQKFSKLATTATHTSSFRRCTVSKNRHQKQQFLMTWVNVAWMFQFSCKNFQNYKARCYFLGWAPHRLKPNSSTKCQEKNLKIKS